MAEKIQVTDEMVSAVLTNDSVKEALSLRGDGWENIYSNMGIKNKDKKTATTFGASRQLTEQVAENLYTFDGLARKVVDVPANDMTKKWVTINGDPEGLILSYMKGIHAQKMYNAALKLARTYGGALLFIGADDGSEELEEPLNMNKIATVSSLLAFSSRDVNINTTDLEKNPLSPNFNDVAVYEITPPRSGESIRIHKSRLVSFVGEVVPPRLIDEYRGFGAPTLQLVFSQLRDVNTAFDHVGTILDDFITGKLKIANLKELVAEGKENLVLTRIDLLSLGKSIINTMILGDNESYEKESSSVAGLSDLIDRFMMWLSAVTNIPVTKLFGRSAGGLNSTGEGDDTNYTDWIAAKQESDLRLPIERLIEIIVAAKDFQAIKGAKDIENTAFSFVPLKQMSESEQGELRKSQSETDKNYIESGVLDPEEVAASRFGGDSYSTDTVLDEEARASAKDEPLDDGE